MVREARFAWDEREDRFAPYLDNDFDHLDELVPDDCGPVKRRKRSPAQSTKPRRRRKSLRPSDPASERRHLAGADWLTSPQQTGHDSSRTSPGKEPS